MFLKAFKKRKDFGRNKSEKPLILLQKQQHKLNLLSPNLRPRQNKLSLKLRILP